MTKRPSYQELEQRVKKLEKEAVLLKKAQKALLGSEERYRILVETSPDVISRVSTEEETITSLNPAFEKMTGWSRKEWIGKPFLSIIHPDDVPLATEKYQQFLRGEALSPFELRILSKSGEELIAEFMIEPDNKSGKRLGYFGFVRDITERKRAEAALREQALRNETILQTAMDGFCIMSMEGNIIETNEAARRIYGYSKEDLDGMNICDAGLAHDTTLKNFVRHRDKVKKEGSHRLEMKIRCKDGRIADVALSLNFVDIGEGFFYCFLHDITEKKLAEKALKERERELKIKSRTLEETNAALRHLLKRREADKSELEEKVLTNVRELILPYLEKMKSGNLDIEQKAFLGVIESNLNDIVSAYVPGLPMKFLTLTPTEIRVANLVKQGRYSKDIAKLMNLSRRTVESHRDSIRRKFGIKGTETNLRSFLLSIEQPKAG